MKSQKQFKLGYHHHHHHHHHHHQLAVFKLRVCNVVSKTKNFLNNKKTNFMTHQVVNYRNFYTNITFFLVGPLRWKKSSKVGCLAAALAESSQRKTTVDSPFLGLSKVWTSKPRVLGFGQKKRINIYVEASRKDDLVQFLVFMLRGFLKKIFTLHWYKKRGIFTRSIHGIMMFR